MEAAEPELAGDVAPGTSGGVIRYRIWPARRHPILAAEVATGAGDEQGDGRDGLSHHPNPDKPEPAPP